MDFLKTHESPRIDDMLKWGLPGSRAQVLAGVTYGSHPIDEALLRDKTFDGIPTMVTARELRFLMNYFHEHRISGDVLEIGSYLGGSTGAIGRGLAASGFADTYYVLDQFSCDFEGFRSAMVADCEVLARVHPLSASAWKAIRANDWLPTFREVHATRPYADFLKADRYLMPSKIQDPIQQLPLPATVRLGAVFIDGFKSWYATYVAMRAILPHISAGTVIIFQDFSWFDCYWLPILANRLASNIAMVAKVDNTAAFVVNDADLSSGIESFGPEAKPAEAEFYRTVLGNYAAAMYHSGDDVGFLSHSAQHYALCHHLGLLGEAEAELAFLEAFCRRVNAEWLTQTLRSALPFPQAGTGLRSAG